MYKILRILLNITLASGITSGIVLITYAFHNAKENGLILAFIYTVFYIVLTIELNKEVLR